MNNSSVDYELTQKDKVTLSKEGEVQDEFLLHIAFIAHCSLELAGRCMFGQNVGFVSFELTSTSDDFSQPARTKVQVLMPARYQIFHLVSFAASAACAF